MRYQPSLPPTLADRVAEIADQRGSGVATLYCAECEMVLKAGFHEGQMLSWTLLHPITPEQARDIIEDAPGERIPSAEVH